MTTATMGKMEAKIERREYALIDVKASVDRNGVGTFSGYGATFGNTDLVDDVIQRGAFARTLKEWQSEKGKWPKMLLQHGGFMGNADDLLPIGQYTHMEENQRGLKVEGRLFAMSTDRGQYIYEGLKSGELDSLSIGYYVRQSKIGTKPGEPARTLIDIDLKEVSLVTFPANDKAVITAVKSLTTEQKRDLEEALHDAGLSRKDCRIAVSLFQKSILRDAGDPSLTPRDEVVTDEQAVLEALNTMSTSMWAEVFKQSNPYN